MATRAARGRTRRNRTTAHEGFLRHANFRWLKVALVLSGLALAAYLFADVQPRPNGGSWLGYTLGTVGALLILWLTLLGIRKRAITPGRWSLKGWTSAHVYLGLSLLVVATLHTGFQFGWNVHTLAYGLMIAVIASGVWGISAYAVLPRDLSANRGEMTKVQLLDAVRKIDRQLFDAAQNLGHGDAAIVRKSIEDDPFAGGLVSRLTGNYPGCTTARAMADIRARQSREAGANEDALDVVGDLLAKKEAMLDRIREALRLRAMLELWLFVHVPLTFALIAALAAHIVSVFFYW